MNLNTDTEKKLNGWDRNSWLWVLFCIIAIYSTIPLAGKLQKFVYLTIGKEFFTYVVFFVIIAVAAALLYLFVFRLKIENVSQYIWLFICGGLCIYFTILLRKYPEEAIHLLEYGFLSILVFRALSHKIHDWTVYISAILIVSFFGTADEFIQWMMPKRFWGMNDIGINALAAAIFQLAIRKAICPKIISKPVTKTSVRLLIGTLILNLLFLGICLSNTPETITRYTSVSEKLSWLRNEETMAEYGYKYKDPEFGVFYSRLSLEELRDIDLKTGNYFREILSEDISPGPDLNELRKIYTPFTNKFLHEFLMHVSRRDNKLEKFNATKSLKNQLKTYKEILILDKYFSNTSKNFSYARETEKVETPGDLDLLWEEEYDSKAGKLITMFSLKTAWTAIFVLLFIALISGELWKRKLDERITPQKSYEVSVRQRHHSRENGNPESLQTRFPSPIGNDGNGVDHNRRSRAPRNSHD